LGTLTLAVSNGFTGTTLVAGGTLILADSNALSGSTFDTSGTGALSFRSAGAAFGGLQGSGGLLLTNLYSVDVALTMGLNNDDTTFSGNLTDSSSGGSLMKVGAGTLVLTGTNTYGGGTFVEGGSLVVTSNEGLADGSSLTVGDPSLLTLFGGVEPAGRASDLRAVPEPSALALLAAAALVLIPLRRVVIARSDPVHFHLDGSRRGLRIQTHTCAFAQFGQDLDKSSDVAH
jgi:autotransporter-associated beta strand protein